MPRACSGSGEALSGIDESQERRKEKGEKAEGGGLCAALRAGAIYWRVIRRFGAKMEPYIVLQG